MKDSQALSEDVKILQSWQGDYPVAQLQQLPLLHREAGLGFIENSEVFAVVWAFYKPGEDVPRVDFENQLVLFARNTQFYNRNSIGLVKVTDGILEVLAMETMTALPIEDKVAMSLAVIDRKGITGLFRSKDDIVSLESH